MGVEGCFIISELVINWNFFDFYVKNSTIALKHLFLMAGWPDLQDTLALQEVWKMKQPRIHQCTAVKKIKLQTCTESFHLEFAVKIQVLE